MTEEVEVQFCPRCPCVGCVVQRAGMECECGHTGYSHMSEKGREIYNAYVALRNLDPQLHPFEPDEGDAEGEDTE